MHIQKTIYGEILTAAILSKKTEPNSFIHMFNVSTLYRPSIKAQLKAVIGVDRPFKTPSMHIQKTY